MMLVSCIRLFLSSVISLELGLANPIHNNAKEYNHQKSFYDPDIPAPIPKEIGVVPKKLKASSQEYALSASESPVSSQELTASSLQLGAAEANKEPTSVRKSSVTYQQSTMNSQRSLVNAQKFTSSLTEDIDRSKARSGRQKSTHSTIASSQISTITSLRNPDTYNLFTSGNILQRVKRQQRWRRKQYNRRSSSHNIHAGKVTKFCNNFGCNNQKKPAKHSRCPSETRFDRKSKQCRRLLMV